MTSSPLERFAAELARWRTERGLSKKQLAATMGFDASYVSHIEAGRHKPSYDFARRADAVLDAGGSVWQRYTEFAATRTNGGEHRAPVIPRQWSPPVVGLVVEREVASVSHRDGAYHVGVHRSLLNTGPAVVTRMPIRVSVDRYPDDLAMSHALYQANPLHVDDLGLTATMRGVDNLRWRVTRDRPDFKEIWLLFEGPQANFPLNPGQRAGLDYSYAVDDQRFGQWFERSVQWPTHRLDVRLDLPSRRQPVVWGTQTSLSAEAVPLNTPILETESGDRTRYSWGSDDPALHSRTRLNWHYRD